MPILELPSCKFCGIADAHRCAFCDEWTCWECVQIWEGEYCSHDNYARERSNPEFDLTSRVKTLLSDEWIGEPMQPVQEEGGEEPKIH